MFQVEKRKGATISRSTFDRGISTAVDLRNAPFERGEGKIEKRAMSPVCFVMHPWFGNGARKRRQQPRDGHGRME